jgi:hypothetical protein
VHDVVARGQVVEEALGGTRPRARLAVRTAPAGDVRFGHDGELRGGDDAPAVQGCHDDVHAGPADLGVEAVLGLVHEQVAGEAFALEDGRHPFCAAAAVGTDHDPVSRPGELGQATGEPRGVAQHRRPAGSLKRDRAGALGHRQQRCHPGGTALQETVEAEMEPRHPRGDLGRVEPPGRCEALAERHLLVQQLGRPVAQASRLDEHHPGARLEEVGEEVLGRAEPRQPRLHAVEELTIGDPGEVVAGEGGLC